MMNFILTIVGITIILSLIDLVRVAVRGLARIVGILPPKPDRKEPT